MVVTARADLQFALIGYLLTFPELTSLVDSNGGWKGTGSGARISPSFQGGPNGWKMPTRAIWLKESGGPPGDYEVGIQTTRLDVRCYGPTGYDAGVVWGMLDAILVPATGARMVSFERNGCKVIDIRPEAGKLADLEPQTNYPYAFRPYLVVWSGVAA